MKLFSWFIKFKHIESHIQGDKGANSKSKKSCNNSMWPVAKVRLSTVINQPKFIKKTTAESVNKHQQETKAYHLKVE